MKKIYTVLVFIFCFGFSHAQNYTQNTSFDSTLFSGTYTVIPGCTSTLPLKIQLSPSLFSYVSGMQFMVIIDSVSFPGPSSSCPVKKGDTTVLNSSNPLFSTIAVSGLKYWFRIELVGTPTISGQSYPCHLQILQCLCFCTDITIQASTTSTSTCFVNLANSINESDPIQHLSIYPNPASDIVFVRGITGETDLNIYNLFGQLVASKRIRNDDQMDIHSLSSGVYKIVMLSDNQNVITSKLSIER